MAHVTKFTKAACGHMFAHYDRKAEHISNEDVDRERTHLNYNLASDLQKLSQGEYLRKRCSEVKVQNRKDVNVMCSWVVTAPKNLPEEDLEKFFKSTYTFLNNRYGKDNVVSAYVHMDETTPHIHYAFVPVVKDKKKDIYKVSAKECLTRKDLQTFHQDLDKYLFKEFGRSVGVLNGATKEGNIKIPQLKEQQKKVVELQKEIDEKQYTLKTAETALQAIKDPQRDIRELGKLTSSDKRKKAFLWRPETVTRTVEDDNKIIESAQEGTKARYSLPKLRQSVNALEKAVKELEHKVQQLERTVRLGSAVIDAIINCPDIYTNSYIKKLQQAIAEDKARDEKMKRDAKEQRKLDREFRREAKAVERQIEGERRYNGR